MHFNQRLIEILPIVILDLEKVKIEEFYGVDASPNLKRNFWGSWSNATGLNVTEEYQWERRKDLTGVTIKATTTNVCTLKLLWLIQKHRSQF